MMTQDEIQEGLKQIFKTVTVPENLRGLGVIVVGVSPEGMMAWASSVPYASVGPILRDLLVHYDLATPPPDPNKPPTVN